MILVLILAYHPAKQLQYCKALVRDGQRMCQCEYHPELTPVVLVCVADGWIRRILIVRVYLGELIVSNAVININNKTIYLLHLILLMRITSR